MVHMCFYFRSFSFSHISVWQLSLEQAGTCITANERQWVCTFITFQQPLEKKGQDRKGGSKRDRVEQSKSEVRVKQVIF